jgi:hypothetical protein
MAQVTLEYTAPVGLQPAATIANKLGAISIYRGELDMLGLVRVSDSAAVVSGEAVRTIVLETTTDGDVLWPDADALESATRNLYTQSLAYALPGKVSAAEPVVA